MKRDKTDVSTLVKLVLATAITDRTTPDSANLKNAWSSDSLFQTIDRLMVIENNDPSAYAEIGRQVLKKVRHLPEIAALAQLAILRGKRLLPINPKRKKAILQIIQELENAIAALPDGTRKMRIRSLFEYHAGIFYSACGLFSFAAELQRQAAQEAERFNDRAGATISYFIETLDHLRHALLSGESAGELEAIFSTLEERFRQLVKELRGSQFEVQWAEGNGPVHMIEACLWLNRDHADWDDWVKTSLAAAEKLGKSWEPVSKFVQAVDMAKRGDPQSNKALDDIGKGSDVNERKATALLALARRFRQTGREDIKGVLEQMPGQGAQHVRAIAKRLAK